MAEENKVYTIEEIREARKQEVRDDIEIAKDKIKEALLYPQKEILYELYAIPSHNEAAFFALVYKEDDKYKMVYARSEVYTPQNEEPIRMYTFKTCIDANESGYDGRIIIGMASLEDSFANELLKVTDKIDGGILYYQNMLILDGVMQYIRVVKEDKEIFYEETRALVSNGPLSEAENEFMETLYQTIGSILMS